MNSHAPASGAGRVIGLFPELLGVGGVQEAGRMAAAALAAICDSRACSVEFLSLNDAPGPHALPATPAVALRGFGRAKAGFTLAALGQARAADIVVALHPNLALPASLMRVANPRLRTILVCHGIEVWKLLPSVRRRALASATLVVAPSRYTAEQLATVQGIAPGKIRRLPWPLSPNFLRFADAPGNLALPDGFPSGRTILTVGRWAAAERYKGADELISAVAALSKTFSDLQLVAVGGGDDLPRLRRLAADLGVASRVHFFEGISREQTAACYARADVFALPSTGEGFGLVFLEAMAFAKPIVGVSAGGATDLIEDGVNGFAAPPADREGLERALTRLLENEPLRREIGQRGSQIVREKYAFATFQRNLQQILDECAH